MNVNYNYSPIISTRPLYCAGQKGVCAPMEGKASRSMEQGPTPEPDSVSADQEISQPL
jgi:hypothetical protein